MDLGWCLGVFYAVIAKLFHLSLGLSHVKVAKGDTENSNCSTAAVFFTVLEEKENQKLVNLL